MSKIQTDWIRLVDELHKTALSVWLKSDQIENLGARLPRTELLLPVIGSFSAGKSSLLNAFLQKEVLPIGLAPETELATELRFGEDPNALAMRPDGTGERIEVDALTSIKARASSRTCSFFSMTRAGRSAGYAGFRLVARSAQRGDRLVLAARCAFHRRDQRGGRRDHALGTTSARRIPHNGPRHVGPVEPDQSARRRSGAVSFAAFGLLMSFALHY
jgi:hypothetical protein